VLGGVALVHAEQVAGEQRRLVAAGAGADFEDGVALVHRVLGQQLQRISLPAFRLSSSSRRSASAISRISNRMVGIGEQRLDVLEFSEAAR
jgi:hypothetical protein